MEKETNSEFELSAAEVLDAAQIPPDEFALIKLPTKRLAEAKLAALDKVQEKNAPQRGLHRS